jgi:hypothetical protein
MLLQVELVTINQKMYVCIYILHCSIRNDLPISNRAFLFVNNSLHPRAKGVFSKETNQDDYVASYCNTGSLHLIAMVWLCCGFTACCAQGYTSNFAIHDSQLCPYFPANLYKVLLVVLPVISQRRPLQSARVKPSTLPFERESYLKLLTSKRSLDPGKNGTEPFYCIWQSQLQFGKEEA